MSTLDARRQRPASLDSDVRAVLGGTPIAHLATVLPDGSPHAVLERVVGLIEVGM
jgi:hypothetical protein